MKFLLLENIPTITDKFKNNWLKATSTERNDAVSKIIDYMKKPGLNNIAVAIKDNFETNGIDPKTNKFYELLNNLKFAPTASMNDNFRTLTDLQNRGLVDVTHKYLTEYPSLYNRSPQDFEYTVNAFEIVLDPQEVSKYFKDTTYIDIDQFIDPDTDEVLPAGKKGDEPTESIYGVIEEWSKGNESDESYKEEKYSIQDALNHFNVAEDKYDETLIQWTRDSWNYLEKFNYKPKKNNLNYYLDLINQYINDSGVKRLTNAEKDNIRNRKSYNTTDDATEAHENKEGNIVFIRAKEYSADDQFNLSQYGTTTKPNIENVLNDYFIYTGGKWVLYSEYQKNKSTNSKNYYEFLKSKTVSVVSNKHSAGVGCVKAVDRMQ